MNRFVQSAAVLPLLAFGAAAQDTPQRLDTLKKKMVEEGMVRMNMVGAVKGPLVKGMPYSADEITESNQVLADGTRIHRETKVAVYRDSEGRVGSVSRGVTAFQMDGPGVSMGDLGCDGAILATPTGSTAYNLSAGGPVLVPGTDSYVVTFVSPHSLHARSMVLGRPHSVAFRNVSADVPVQAIVDGHVVAVIDPGGRVDVRLGDALAALARVAGTSFFTRYLQEFTH